MGEAEQLQDALSELRARRAPLPMRDRAAAIEYAVAKRREGHSWSAIAWVMADYHGMPYSVSYWRRICKASGEDLGPDHKRRW